jgi:uncharacterized protein (TIRG00374 family)
MSVRARRLVLSAVLGAALLFIFFKGMDWAAVGQAFRRADPLYMAGVALVTVVLYFVRAWRWGYLLRPLARVPLPRLFSVTVLGFAAGLVVPRAGEVLRPYLVARHHSLRTSAAFATIILERLVDLITVLLLFGLYLYVLPMPAAQQRGPLLDVLKAAGALAGLAALTVLGLLVALHLGAKRMMAILDRVIFRLPRRAAEPLSRALYNFAEGLAVLQAPGRHLLTIAAQSVVLWCLICLSIHWTNLAFGLTLPYHTSFLIVGFLTVGVAVPTPGMVGGFHVAYLQALTQAFGVDHATAGAAGIAMHALSNLPVLALGIVFLWREGLTFGRVARIAEDGGQSETQHLMAGVRG